MHVQLLKLALGLYSVGLLHSVFTVLRKKQTLFKPAVVATLIGFAFHAASIVARVYEQRTFPLAQRYESFSFFAALAVLAFLIVYWRYKITTPGIFAFPAIFLMTFVAILQAFNTQDSIPELLRSRWIYIHTPLVILGYVAFFVAFSAAVLYLLQERELKRKRVFNRLPSLEICDDLAYRSLAVIVGSTGVGVLDERPQNSARFPDLADLFAADSLPSDRGLAWKKSRLSGDRRFCWRARDILLQHWIPR
jgi:ABC-type transport system involved in cytochrome c biogenesis permease subunit